MIQYGVAGRAGRRHPHTLPARVEARLVPLRSARLRPGRLPRCCSRRGRGSSGRRRSTSRPRRGALPAVSLDHRRARRGGGHRARRSPTRSRSTTRATASRSSSRCDGCTDATAERAREAGADVVLELAARRQDPRAGRRRSSARAARSSRSATPTRCSSPTRCASSSRRSPTRASATSAARSRSSTRPGTNQEGLYWRYEMALRALESRLARVTGGNGAIYATRREAYVVVDPVMGHDLSLPVQLRQARLARGLPARRARATEKMVPSIEGEFARKRRMMSHAWPIVVRGGLLDPRGYPPRYALMIVSATACCATPAPFLHVARARAARPGRGCAHARAARSPRRSAAACAAPAARRALLRAHAGVDRRSASTTGCATAPRPAGRRRRARGDAAALFDVVVAGAALLAHRRRSSPLAIVAIRLESHGPPDLPPAAHRQGRRARSTCSSCARWSRAPSRWARASRSTRATRASRASARCCAASRSTSCRTSSTSCAATWRSSARARPCRSQVEQYTERQRGRLAVKPGHHRLGAGQRPHVAAVGRAHRARPLVHRAPLAGASTSQILAADRADRPRRRGPLQGRDRRLDG